MFKLRKLIPALSVVFFTAAGFSQTAEEIYQEYLQISQQLQQIQQEAFADKDIENMSKDFSEKLESAIVQDNKDLEPVIEKRKQLIDEFNQIQDTASEVQLKEIQTEFRELSLKLQPAQEKALQKKDIMSDAEELEKAVFEKMEEINPEISLLLQRMNVLENQLQQLQGQQ